MRSPGRLHEYHRRPATALLHAVLATSGAAVRGRAMSLSAHDVHALEAAEKERRGTTTGDVSFYVAKLCTGAGILGLPFAFRQCGIIIACSIVLLCVVLNSIACHLLIACKLHLLHAPELRHGNASTRDSYAMLAQVTLGRFGVHLVDAAICITLFGAAALYQVTVSELLYDLYPAVSQPIYVCVCATLLLPFVFIHDIGRLSYLSGAAVFAYAAAFVIIYLYGAQHQGFAFATPMLFPSASYSLASFAESFGTVCFSLGVPILCFQLQESMRHSRDFFKALDRTLSAVTLGYIAIGVIGVGLFSSTLADHPLLQPNGVGGVGGLPGVQPIILTNLPHSSSLGVVVKMLVCVVLLLTAPLTFVPGLGLLESIVFGERVHAANVLAGHPNSPPLLIRHPAAEGLQLPVDDTMVVDTAGSYGALAFSALPASAGIAAAVAAMAAQAPGLQAGGVDASASPDYGEQKQLARHPPSHLTSPLSPPEPSPEDADPNPTAVRPTPAINANLDPSPDRLRARDASDLQLDVEEADEGARLIGTPDLLPEMAPRRQQFACGALRLTMLMLVVVVATCLPCFELLMSILGCVTLNILSFILPPLFYIRIEWMVTRKEADAARKRLAMPTDRRRNVNPIASRDLAPVDADVDVDAPTGVGRAWKVAGCLVFVAFGVLSLVTTLTIIVLHGKCR